jgi:type II secretion system protein H
MTLGTGSNRELTRPGLLKERGQECPDALARPPSEAPHRVGRIRSSGFTLLEMIVVIALMVIIAAMATLSFIGLEGESEVEKPGNELARMVKQANRAAVVQGRPFVIAFGKTEFGFLDGVGGADGRVTLPKGMKVGFQRWNGGKKWNNAEGLNWTFYPSGICDALRFKFEHPDGMVEMAFNPLTGSVSEEAAYLK